MLVKDLTSAYEGLFDLLRRSLRAGPRADVVEHLRPLFKMMLEAFELRSKADGLDIAKVRAVPSSNWMLLKPSYIGRSQNHRRIYRACHEAERERVQASVPSIVRLGVRRLAFRIS